MLSSFSGKFRKAGCAQVVSRTHRRTPASRARFSAGLSNQPSTTALLRENLGVADTATRAIANRVASLVPLVKTTRLVKQGTEVVETLDDHPLKKLLDRPNPTFSRSQMLRLTTQYLVTVGDAAWVKVGSELGVPVELHPMSPTMYEPIVSRGIVEAYAVTEGNGSRREYKS